jgi:hypothetical protein
MVGDLKTVKFFDDWYKQNFKAYDILIEGDLGFADLVASTNYYKVRDQEVVVTSQITRITGHISIVLTLITRAADLILG